MWEALLVGAVGPQLVQIGWTDLKTWRITNKANGLLAATYFAFALVLSTPQQIALHAGFALILFLALLVPFLRGWVGGGDVKFLTASFLWVGPGCAAVYSIALLPPMLLYLALARLGLAKATKHEGLSRVPFGPIGAAALAFTLVVCRPF